MVSMAVLLTLLRLCYCVYVCAYSPETGDLSTVKIAKEGDKEEIRKVRACEGGGRGGELGEMGRREKEGRKREREGS